MGMVFKALQTSIQRTVAIKTLHPQLAMAPQFFERFRREAEIASKLKHPNIITIYDFGRTPDGLCYFVMELLEGESLRQRIKRSGPLTLRQAAAAIEQVALGLAHAHHQGVIHRDIKPHNVMLTSVDGSEYVKVLDFGLVKAIEQEESEHLTSTGQVLGTPQYMPPEQAGGEVVDQRSDLYSLTGVFYYCLTGHSPFGANSVRKALQAALTQEVPPVSTYRVGAAVPDAIDRFMKKGLAREKEDRFQSAEELIESLHAALSGTPDTVLDAVPQFTKTTSKESGSGSSASHQKGSKPSTRSVSALARPLPKNQPSTVEVAPPVAPARPRNLMVPLAVAAVLVLGTLGVAVVFKLRAKSAAEVPAQDQPQVARVEPPPRPPPEQPRPPPENAALATVKVTLQSAPTGAEVLEDGVAIGTTPMTTNWARATKRTLTFRLAGHHDQEKSFKPEADQEFQVTLEPLKRVAQPPEKGHGKKSDSDIGAFE